MINLIYIKNNDFSLVKHLKHQYEDLIKEASKDKFFYGRALCDMTDRCLIENENHQLVGFFEYGRVEYNGRSYHRSNRPYTALEHRSKGYMSAALKEHYKNKRPGMAWIDDENVASIRLFTSVGFRQQEFLKHKNRKGHVYVLPKNT